MSDKPTFVHRDGMIADNEYVEWISDVKQRFRQSQTKELKIVTNLVTNCSNKLIEKMNT